MSLTAIMCLCCKDMKVNVRVYRLIEGDADVLFWKVCCRESKTIRGRDFNLHPCKARCGKAFCFKARSNCLGRILLDGLSK